MLQRVCVFAGVLLAVAATVLPTRAQAAGPDPRYWPLREIQFPVPVEEIKKQSPAPTKLRFYAAPDRGRFKLITERGVNDLDLIDADKKRYGFRYVSPADGEYDFALQFVYADNDVNPRDAELTAQYRIIFDTRPPTVRVAAAGGTTIEWDVQDENLAADAVQVEVRWQGQQRWTPFTPRPFRARDSYTYTGLRTTDVPLEVRVVARDRAGLEMASRVVTIAATGAASGGGGGLTNDGSIRGDTGGRDPFPPSRASQPNGFANTADIQRPEISFVNTRELTVESKLTHVTRSGVKQAALWVQDDKKRTWTLDKTQAVNIQPGDRDPAIKIPYSATADGLYGFIVVPVNGAGGKRPDPQTNEPAQFLIEVDTVKPFVKIDSVRVSPGGVTGPRVEIQWQATDKNLLPAPIVLEYSPDKMSGEWKTITPEPIAHTGRYVWEVEDKNLWKFYVRIRATDKASNSGVHVYEKEVIIDLETPNAIIEKVQGVGGPQSRVVESERPAQASPNPPPPTTPTTPTTPSPAPAPAAVPSPPAPILGTGTGSSPSGAPRPNAPVVPATPASPSGEPAIPSLPPLPGK
ncbi:hypothetical protein [Fimbriiglobus ruber]|uniref:Ser-Thr-rich glycosyl-phosphatidyl-inositol-anchored membrane family protein n=1 Tax=Fimbriiglobus ruber TaxID=1908690 RepID=A0A225DWG3_9BACT|nr:hypothetical protein [Fimbriiglobus ruber]OWK43904.1 hypothetical protein FRUB_03503 [Fimbriiglobus ruber]